MGDIEHIQRIGSLFLVLALILAGVPQTQKLPEKVREHFITTSHNDVLVKYLIFNNISQILS